MLHEKIIIVYVKFEFTWMPCIFPPVFLFSKFGINELIKLFLTNTFPEMARG